MSTRTRSRYKKEKEVSFERQSSNEPELQPNATLGPEESFDFTQEVWTGPESTNAPSIGDEVDQPEFVSGGFQLFDKFLQGRAILQPKPVILLITICWFAVVSWLYIQDNENGRLVDVNGLLWFGAKAGIYSVFFFIVAAVISLSALRRTK